MPFTYWVFGRPVSIRNEDGDKPAGLAKWRLTVNAARQEAVDALSNGRGFILREDVVEVRIYWMSRDPTDRSQPDLDNILKPFIDALNQTVIEDDRQVHRIIAMKVNINAPPQVLDDTLEELQDDSKYTEMGEVTVVRLVEFASE